MQGVDLVGVGIIKNLLSWTGGPGGAQPPRALQDRRRWCGWTTLTKTCGEYNLLSMTSSLVTRDPPFLKKSEKTKKSPKSTKTQKNTKIVGITSYSQGRLYKNSAPQKYEFLIFRTNEGDFGGTPVKNQ